MELWHIPLMGHAGSILSTVLRYLDTLGSRVILCSSACCLNPTSLSRRRGVSGFFALALDYI